MPGEMYENIEKLKELTKTDLTKDFENLKGFCEDSIHLANECDIDLVLKELAFAELAAHRLIEDANRHFLDGKITGKEYTEITELTTNLIFENLTEAVTNAVVYSCECVKGSLSKN